MKQLKTTKKTRPRYITDQYEAVYQLGAPGQGCTYVGLLNGRTLRQWKKAQAELKEARFWEELRLVPRQWGPRH